MIMNCPVCKKEMKIKKTDVSKNLLNGKLYKRTSYLCKDNDVWVVVEVPANIN